MTRFVLALRFDEQMDRDVRNVWQAMAAEGIAVAGGKGHRPHVSIAAYDVDDVQHACDTLDGVIRRIERFPIRLHSLGIFPERRVVFLAPHMTAALYDLHRKVLQAFVNAGYPPVVYEHLEADKWTPHCTLVADVLPYDTLRAVDRCLQTWQPITGWVEAVGLLVPPATDDVYESRLAVPEK
jgi:2'-5' RNA ligase